MNVGAPARPEPAPREPQADDEAPDRRECEPPGPFAGPLGRWFLIGVVGAVALGVVLRFVTRSDLWLDEALTVNIARRPLGELGHLLRHDGAPPLYYVVLHGWMRLFGSGDLATRSLSGVIGVASLGCAWLAGARLGGRSPSRRQWVAVAVLLIVTTSPYAVRYATEARMYGLEILLVLVGYLAVWRALEHATFGRLGVVAVVACALLYTQYWSLYLVAVVLAGLGWRAWRGVERVAAMRVLAAVAVGCVGFVPWVPTFLYQLAHTGTPWASSTVPPSGLDLTLNEFSGAKHWEAYVLALPLLLLALLAVFGAARGRTLVELDLRTRPGVRWEWVVGMGTLVLGLTVSYLGGSAFQGRYAALVFPFFVLVAGFGITVFGSSAVRCGVLAFVVVFGLVGGGRNVFTNRTEAGRVAAAIDATAKRGDVVGYCPDQIGPAVSRLVRPGLRQGSFPGFRTPERVDWVGYRARNAAADPVAYAHELVRRAGPDHTVWYVYANGYRTFDDKCAVIGRTLAGLRAAAAESLIAEDDQSFFEYMGLLRFGP